MGVHVWNVQAALKRYQIPTRDYTGSRASQLVIDMTDEMYEVLRGALLGDGWRYIWMHPWANRLSIT